MMAKPTLMLDSRYGRDTDLHNMCMRSDSEGGGNSSNQTRSFASRYVAFSGHTVVYASILHILEQMRIKKRVSGQQTLSWKNWPTRDTQNEMRFKKEINAKK